MDRQKLPLLLMLIAGAVTSITVYFRNLGLETMLIGLLASLVSFYFIGCLIKLVLDKFDEKNQEKKVADEGEVIEKAPDEENVSENENEEGSEPSEKQIS